MQSGNVLTGKVVAITGASSGIGQSTAIKMASLGCRVALIARNVDRLNETANRVHQVGGEALVCPADLTNRDEIRQIFRNILSHWGCVDILVANAGQYVRSPIKELDISAIERSLAINFYGQIYTILEVLPHMMKRREGHIIVVSTVDAKKGLPLDAPYVAAKFALSGFVDVLRQELHGTGIKVTTIFPGRVDTPMIEQLKVPWISAKIPPEKVANAIVRSLFRYKAEVILPNQAKLLCYIQPFFPQLADWVVRVFHLEGWEV